MLTLRCSGRAVVALTLGALALGGCTFPPPPNSAAAPTPEVPAYRSEIEDPQAKALYHYGLARLYMAEEAWDAAEAALEKALAFDPDNVDLIVAYGQVLLQLDKEPQALEVLQRAVQLAPDNVEVLQHLGRLLARQGRAADAVVHLRRAMELVGDDDKLLMQLTMSLLQAGQPDVAEQELRDYLKRNPDALAAKYALARLYMQLKRPALAESYYRAVIAQQPLLRPAILELSTLLAQEQRLEDALTLLRQATHNDPDETIYRHQAVQLLIQEGRLVEARSELEAVLAQDPEDAEALNKLGLLHLNADRFDMAEAMFRRLVALHPDNPRALYYLGLALERQDRLEEAERSYARVDVDDAVGPDALAHRSYLLRRLGRVDEAAAVLQSALSEGHTDRVELYLYLAGLLRELKDPEGAIAVLQKGAERFPTNTRFPYQIGIVLDESGRKDEAMAIMDRVLELDPNNADALNYKAYALAESGERLEEALGYIQQALERKRPGYMIDTLGWILFKLGRLEEARVQMEQAVAMMPEDMLVLEHLADVYAAIGDREKAVRAYERILQQTPDNKDVQQKLKEVKGR